MSKNTTSSSAVPWGGIGGSGKHSNDIQPEPKTPVKEDSKSQAPQWGGVGGSGKHTYSIEPEPKA